MGLSWRDALATLLVAAAAAVTLSVVYGWNWPLIGDARAGVVALFVLSFPACIIGGGPAWIAAMTRGTTSNRGTTWSRGASWSQGAVWNPFLLLAAALGSVAFILMVVGLIVDTVPILVSAAAAVVAIWVVATVHHILQPIPHPAF